MAISVALVVVVLYLVFDVFTSGSNVIARVYMYLMLGGGALGLLSPRPSFHLLVVLTAYLDFFKRLMIFDSGVSQMDLYYVLGIAPAIVCGIACNVLYGCLGGRGDCRASVLWLALSVITLCAAASFVMMAGATEGKARALGNVVNGVVYLLLLFVVPALFPKPEDLRRLLKFIIIAYIPAVCYMLTHWFRGIFLKMNPPIFDWELDYVLSGLTIEIRQLGERVFRSFGTFNSAANASMVFAGLLGLVCSAIWKAPVNGQSPGSARVLRFVLVPMIVVAMWATYSRTGWVFAAALLFAPAFLRSRIATIGAYAVGIAAIGGLVVASPYLLKYKVLNKISQDVYAEVRTAEWSQATNLSTMNDRLEGFAALLQNPRIWTPFGFRFKYANPTAAMQSLKVHDAVSMVLMRYGYVPLTGMAIAAFVLLVKCHRFILRESVPLAKCIGSTCMAIGLILLSGIAVNSAQLVTYPVNFWIWFMFSCVGSLMLWRKEEDRVAKLALASPGNARRPARVPSGGIVRPAHA